MLRTLSIRNIVLIERLDLEFDTGLAVLTGETGSGKSILLDALGLAIGVRGDNHLVRQGAEKSSVTAEFDVSENVVISDFLAENSIENNPTLILRRTISADGRSRAFINDQAVSVTLLRQVGEFLVEIHGQLETHGLLNPMSHRGFVDAYGNHDDLISLVSQSFKEWNAALSTLEKAKQHVEYSRRDEEFLGYAINELTQLDPKVNEEKVLAAQRTSLMHAEQLIGSVQEAFKELNEGKGVEGALRAALQTIQRTSDKAGGNFDTAISSLERCLLEAAESIADLERLSDILNVDPQQLEQIEERLFALRRLARKHNIDVEKLPSRLEEMQKELTILTDGSADLAELVKKVDIARVRYVDVAGRLSNKRKAIATKLDRAVTQELTPLKLEAAIFQTSIKTLNELEWNEFGTEYIIFHIQTNPNTAAGPINKIASGGELARIMLALKVVLADADAAGTIIFDEVDAGIGGAAAAAVGERLSLLAKSVQVLVVTHSPQVAARGNTHFNISKSVGPEGNLTHVEELFGEVREEEIARMLSGAKITGEARAAAVSLLGGKEGS
jgi:DNA repair protein RecN (Recombination protein N)